MTVEVRSIAVALLGIIVTALIGLVPVYVAYDIYDRGPVAGKRVTYDQIGPINPMDYVSLFGRSDGVALSLTVNKRAIKNLFIVQGLFRNVGQSTILPTDFHENLSANISKPWKIISIQNSDPRLRNVQLQWTRINDQRYEAAPTLLNPGDRVTAIVYVTNPASDGSSTGKTEEPKIEWKVRIAGLQGFDAVPDFREELTSRYTGLYVQLSGWSLPFVLISALLFQALYLHLLHRAGVLGSWGWRTIGFVLLATLISFAAADASATYIFGNDLIRYTGVDHRVNAPPIVLNAVALFVLWRVSVARIKGMSVVGGN